jgi:NACalpha-BTF3-like transcription factor
MSFPALCSTELLVMFEEQKALATRVMQQRVPYPVSKNDRHAWQEHPVKRRETETERQYRLAARDVELMIARTPLAERLQARREAQHAS